MAFDLRNWSRVTDSMNTGAKDLGEQGVVNAPAIFSYRSDDDTLAQISAPNYFGMEVQNISEQDIIWAKGSDGIAQYVVTSVNRPSFSISITEIPGIQSITAGSGISVDDTDPSNPIVSATGGEGETTLFEPRLIFSFPGSAVVTPVSRYGVRTDIGGLANIYFNLVYSITRNGNTSAVQIEDIPLEGAQRLSASIIYRTNPASNTIKECYLDINPFNLPGTIRYISSAGGAPTPLYGTDLPADTFQFIVEGCSFSFPIS